MSNNDNNFTVDQLLDHAGCAHPDEHTRWGKPIAIANAKLGIESNQLTKRTQELTEEQIQASLRANGLTEKLLRSNEKASQQNEASAALMNAATQELAKSTSSLKFATWALVLIAIVQALIALFKK